MAEVGFLFEAGFVLILVGIAIVVVALLLLSVRSAKNSNVKAGGAIIVGPVPIVFGTDRKSLKSVLLMSIALTLLLLVLFVLQYLLPR